MEYVTFGIALLGAVLGVIATWHQVNQTKVRIRVRFRMWLFVSDEGVDKVPRPTVEVTNLSAFPVWINTVGLQMRRPKEWRLLKNPLVNSPTRSLPHKLEPRQSLSAFGNPGALTLDELRRIRKAWARTDCGLTIKGSARAAREHVKREDAEAPSAATSTTE